MNAYTNLLNFLEEDRQRRIHKPRPEENLHDIQFNEFLEKVDEVIASLKTTDKVLNFLTRQKQRLVDNFVKASNEDLRLFQSSMREIDRLLELWKLKQRQEKVDQVVLQSKIPLTKDSISVPNETNIIEASVHEKIKVELNEKSLPECFSQITCRKTPDEILRFLNILAFETNNLNGLPYMSLEDINELAKKNITNFNCEPTGKYFKLNLTQKQKGRLCRFAHDFHSECGLYKQGEKMKYVYFLIHNFELFKDDKPRSLYANMNKEPKGDGRIPYEKYFPKQRKRAD